jgi:hypothetical protein
VILFLHSKPDLRIEYSAVFQSGNSISMISDPTFVTKMDASSDCMTSETASQITLSTTESSHDDGQQGMFYKLQLIHSGLSANGRRRSLVRALITMMNVLGSSSFHQEPLISAESVEAPLVMSATSVAFGVAPIFDPRNANSRAARGAFTLSNNGRSGLDWHLDVISIPDVFAIEPMAGGIDAGFAINQCIFPSPRNMRCDIISSCRFVSKSRKKKASWENCNLLELDQRDCFVCE